MAGLPMITKPAVVPMLGAVRHMVLFESVAMIVDGHAGEALLVQVEQVNTSVAPAPLSVSVTFFRSSVVPVLL
jgi:hypothetical protein